MVAQTDDSTVERAWVRFSSDLRRFIGRRVATPSDADDILQLVFLRMTERGGAVSEERVAAWLYTTTRNAITDHYRSAVRRREVLTEGPLVDGPAPEEKDDGAAAEAQLARCLAPMVERLPAEQAEALRMVDLGGMTQTAAAAAAGVSVPGMKSRVQRGRRRLHELLQECCHVEHDVRGRVMAFTPPAERTTAERTGCAGCSPT